SLLMNGDDTLILGGHSVDPGDVIWIRRPEVPVPNPKVSESDKKFASLEYRCFYHSIAYFFETLPVWCINNYSAARVMIQKAVQIRLARQCGLKIPATLMSNNPATVRKFFAREKLSDCRRIVRHQGGRDLESALAGQANLHRFLDHHPRSRIVVDAPHRQGLKEIRDGMIEAAV